MAKGALRFGYASSIACSNSFHGTPKAAGLVNFLRFNRAGSRWVVSVLLWVVSVLLLLWVWTFYKNVSYSRIFWPLADKNSFAWIHHHFILFQLLQPKDCLMDRLTSTGSLTLNTFPAYLGLLVGFRATSGPEVVTMWCIIRWYSVLGEIF